MSNNIFLLATTLFDRVYKILEGWSLLWSRWILWWQKVDRII